MEITPSVTQPTTVHPTEILNHTTTPPTPTTTSVHPCVSVPPHSSPSHPPPPMPQHHYPPEIIYLPIRARYSSRSPTLLKWTIDDTAGPDIHTGMQVMLYDEQQQKQLVAFVKEVVMMEKHWIEFLLLAHEEQTVKLVVPRIRSRLGPIKAILHLILRPWLPNSLPPPVMPTPRSMMKSNIRVDRESRWRDD
jgi:hypothetical protein